jgi:predicted CXXCH cytochrome family protein
MKWVAITTATVAGLAIALSGCGTDGATRYVGPAPTAEQTFGSCTFCHGEVAEPLLAHGHGDAQIRCDSACHASDLRPGEVGPGHRNVPRCADCHDEQQTHQDAAAGTTGECTNCHTPHGSANLFLVKEVIAPPGGSARMVTFTSLDGRGDGGFTTGTGAGLCEVCHRETRYFRSDGSGEEHFTFPCFTCHPHTAGFAPQ